MNKIFKKVWNKARGCFVAVAEDCPSLCKGGQIGTAVLISSLSFCSLILPSEANALLTYEGNTTLSQFPLDEGPRQTDSIIVNGNLTSGTFSEGWYIIAVTDKHYYYPTNTLTVNGNFLLENGLQFSVSNNRKHSGEVAGKLIVNGSMTVHGTLLNVRINDDYHDGSANSYISVRDTLTISPSGFFGDLANYGSLISTSDIGRLVNQGTVDFASVGTAKTTYGSIENYGTFKQPSNNTVRVNGNFIQNSGTFFHNDSIVVGANEGKMSIGGNLTLKGGSITGNDTIIQKGSQIEITSGSYSFGSLQKMNGTVKNNGTLSIINLNQGSGSTTNTGNLTIANGNLAGALVNQGTVSFTGTVVSTGDISSTKTLNNSGNWTAKSLLNIGGILNNTGAINFQNGFALAAGSKLNSSGTIQTNNAFNVFDSLGSQGQTALTTVSMDAQLPEETKTALTDFFRHYVPGTVAQNLVDHATFSGGKVIVTGVNLTQTQADDLKKEFKSKFVVFEFYRLSSFSSSRRTK